MSGYSHFESGTKESGMCFSLSSTSKDRPAGLASSAATAPTSTPNSLQPPPALTPKILVVIYCRSSTKPHHYWSIKPKNSTMDVVYLHDKRTADDFSQIQIEHFAKNLVFFCS